MTMEIKRYKHIKTNDVVELILEKELFVRVRPAKGLDIVLSPKSFKKKYEKIN